MVSVIFGKNRQRLHGPARRLIRCLLKSQWVILHRPEYIFNRSNIIFNVSCSLELRACLIHPDDVYSLHQLCYVCGCVCIRFHYTLFGSVCNISDTFSHHSRSAGRNSYNSKFAFLVKRRLTSKQITARTGFNRSSRGIGRRVRQMFSQMVNGLEKNEAVLFKALTELLPYGWRPFCKLFCSAITIKPTSQFQHTLSGSNAVLMTLTN